MSQFKKRIFLFFCYVFIANKFYSQQTPLYSQYYLNPIIYNPSLVGVEDVAKVFLFHRDQWTSIEGAPKSNLISFDSPLKSKKIALGISFNNETAGLNSNTGVYGYYSYKMLMSDSGAIRFGIAIGAINNRLETGKALVENRSDPYLTQDAVTKFLFDSKAGISYSKKKFQMGVGILQLTGNSLQNKSTTASYNLNRVFAISTKYEFDLNKEKQITITPYILSKISNASPIQYDVSGILNWKNVGWVAATYRSKYAIGLNVGVKLFKNLSLGYAYDVITNPLKSYSGISQEIMLGYTFTKKPKRAVEQEEDAGDVIQQIVDFFEKKSGKDTKTEIEKINKNIEKKEKAKEKEKGDNKKINKIKKRNKGNF